MFPAGPRGASMLGTPREFFPSLNLRAADGGHVGEVGQKVPLGAALDGLGSKASGPTPLPSQSLSAWVLGWDHNSSAFKYLQCRRKVSQG